MYRNLIWLGKFAIDEQFKHTCMNLRKLLSGQNDLKLIMHINRLFVNHCNLYPKSTNPAGLTSSQYNLT